MPSDPINLILLDRDGVILKHVDPYILSYSDVEFINGSIESIQRLLDHGFSVSVVTNQSPVSRGLISNKFVDQTNEMIAQQLRTNGHLRFYYCPHSSEDGCSCRKPLPGMLLHAIESADSEPHRSVMVGDHETDMEASLAAGCHSHFQVLSGRQDVVSPLVTAHYENLEEFASEFLRGFIRP